MASSYSIWQQVEGWRSRHFFFFPPSVHCSHLSENNFCFFNSYHEYTPWLIFLLRNRYHGRRRRHLNRRLRKTHLMVIQRCGGNGVRSENPKAVRYDDIRLQRLQFACGPGKLGRLRGYDIASRHFRFCVVWVKMTHLNNLRYTMTSSPSYFCLFLAIGGGPQKQLDREKTHCKFLL